MAIDVLEKRFDYLAKVLEEDQSYTLFEETKKLLLDVITCLQFDTPPEIGVDDEGRSIAEWHNYHEYSVFSIVPYSMKKILFEGIKKDSTCFSITTSVNNLVKNTRAAFFFGLNDNYAISA